MSHFGRGRLTRFPSEINRKQLHAGLTNNGGFQLGKAGRTYCTTPQNSYRLTRGSLGGFCDPPHSDASRSLVPLPDTHDVAQTRSLSRHEAYVWAPVKALLSAPEVLRKQYAQGRDDPAMDVRAEQERVRLEHKLASLDREVTRLIDAYRAEVIDLTALGEQRLERKPAPYCSHDTGHMWEVSSPHLLQNL